MEPKVLTFNGCDHLYLPLSKKENSQMNYTPISTASGEVTGLQGFTHTCETPYKNDLKSQKLKRFEFSLGKTENGFVLVEIKIQSTGLTNTWAFNSIDEALAWIKDGFK